MANGQTPVDILLGLARINAASDVVKTLAVGAYVMGQGAPVDTILAVFNEAATTLEHMKADLAPKVSNCPTGTTQVDSMCV